MAGIISLDAAWGVIDNGEKDRFGNTYAGHLRYTPTTAKTVGTDADLNSRTLDADARHAVITCEGADGYWNVGEAADATVGTIIKDGIPLIITNNRDMIRRMSIFSASGTFKIKVFK